MSDSKAVIFDIDSTIADNMHRHHIAKESDWPKFHSQCMLDSPILPMINLLKLLHLTHQVFLCTARPEYIRSKTLGWLSAYTGIDFSKYLMMRQEGDERRSFEIKLDMLNQIRKHYDILCAFEDNDDCINMYMQNGIFCLKPGDVSCFMKK